MAMQPSLFASTQLALLTTERTVDTQQSNHLISSLPPQILSKQHGLAILNLNITSQRTGLGGKLLLELERSSAVSGSFPKHTFRAGDMVRVEEMPSSGSAKKLEKREATKKGVQGVVVKVEGEKKIVVAVEKARAGGVSGGSDDDTGGVDALLQVAGEGRLWVIKVANEVTYIRMEKAMETLTGLHDKGGLTHLHRVLLGLTSPLPVTPEDEATAVENWFDENLNDSQKSAVRFALASPDLALIHGPPGTGKTQTLIEILQQLVRVQGKRVLVCGPSNISVDNILLRLPSDIPAIRIGHPARLLPGVVSRSLDVLVRTSEAAEIVGDVRRELDEKIRRMGITGKGRLRGSERKEGWREVRDLRAEYRHREDGAVRNLVSGSKVVVATLHGASGGGGRWLRGERFDVVVIDEGSQALEAQSWGAILHGAESSQGGVGKLIIAGDHMQLPPTVKSEGSGSSSSSTTKNNAPPPPPPTKFPKPQGDLVKANIPITLSLPMFTRLLRTHGEGIKRLLTTQYRMHRTIMTFPSRAFYGGKLNAADSVKGHLLHHLPGVAETEDTNEPVIWIDTQGGDFPESVPQAETTAGINSDSKSNPGEVLLVVGHVAKLLNAGVRGSDIAVITPYAAQLGLLVAAFTTAATHATGTGGENEWINVELSSIDGFQGREKAVVVISLVRSNGNGEIGFLKEGRRMNVAITRPRMCLVVIGDGETLRGRGGGGSKNAIASGETGKLEIEEGEFVRRWVQWLEVSEEGVDIRYPSLEEAVREAGDLGVA